MVEKQRGAAVATRDGLQLRDRMPIEVLEQAIIASGMTASSGEVFDVVRAADAGRSGGDGGGGRRRRASQTWRRCSGSKLHVTG